MNIHKQIGQKVNMNLRPGSSTGASDQTKDQGGQGVPGGSPEALERSPPGPESFGLNTCFEGELKNISVQTGIWTQHLTGCFYL